MKEMEKRRIGEGDGKSLCGRKGKRKKELKKKREKEGEERRGRKRKIENEEGDT